MLALGRKDGQRIRLKTAAGEIIWITVVEYRNAQTVIGIEAPLSVEAKREEILPIAERYEEEDPEAANLKW